MLCNQDGGGGRGDGGGTDSPSTLPSLSSTVVLPFLCQAMMFIIHASLSIQGQAVVTRGHV